MKKFVIASAVSLAMLLLVNLFVFPLVFGSGIPLPFTGLRSQPVYWIHGVALLMTAVLLVAICIRAANTPQNAMVTAAIAGLLASLPAALHTYAMVDIPIGTQIAPIAWTAFSWSMAGSTIGLVLYGRKATTEESA